ncbi:uncharacterized protein [Panulirus ornatus]|uniref:uncharacterized protein isoform X2 n=1 Tax=Panulirus ornatus TaxID=150431 RepID=UPI003A866421
MKGLPLSKCVLLALTLLIPARHGRGHSREDGSVHGRFSSQDRTHLAQKTAFQQLLKETFAKLLDTPVPSDSRFPPPLLSNDLEDIGISPEEEALYSARDDDRDVRPREGSRPRYLSGRYLNYHEEVCITKKGWRELYESVDVDGNEVVIVNSIGGPNQTYYSYECEEPCTACKGVIGHSMCKMRYTYVKMYYQLKHGRRSNTPRWDFVEVPSHCACELVPENAIDRECLED